MGQVAPTITCMHPSRTLVCSKLRPDGFLRAGKDAARAFATGCFATHQTHDIRGLNERETKVSRQAVLYKCVCHFILFVDTVCSESGSLEGLFRKPQEIRQSWEGDASFY